MSKIVYIDMDNVLVDFDAEQVFGEVFPGIVLAWWSRSFSHEFSLSGFWPADGIRERPGKLEPSRFDSRPRAEKRIQNSSHGFYCSDGQSATSRETVRNRSG